jgi:hypothetical protein
MGNNAGQLMGLIDCLAKSVKGKCEMKRILEKRVSTKKQSIMPTTQMDGWVVVQYARKEAAQAA